MPKTEQTFVLDTRRHTLIYAPRTKSKTGLTREAPSQRGGGGRHSQSELSYLSFTSPCISAVWHLEALFEGIYFRTFAVKFSGAKRFAAIIANITRQDRGRDRPSSQMFMPQGVGG